MTVTEDGPRVTAAVDSPGSASSQQVRGEIERLLGKDLLGPWLDDECEILPPGAVPSDRYILGVLSPAGSTLSAEQTDTSAPDNDTGDGAGEVGAAAAAGSMSPASLGLSFRVSAEIDRVLVTARWGRYAQTTIEDPSGETSTTRRVWQRVPESGDVKLDLTKALPTGDPVASLPGVVVRSRVRQVGQCRFVDVALVNGQPQPYERRDTAKLFQARLTVTALGGGSPVFLPHEDDSHAVAGDTVDVGTGADAVTSDPEVAALRMLYRGAEQFAVGRNCAVEHDCRKGESKAWRLATTSLPTYDIEQTVGPDPASQPLLRGLQLDMRWLATAHRGEVLTALAPLADGYASWLDKEAGRIDSDGDLTLHKTAARANVAAAREMAGRIRAGIDVLAGQDEKAAQAWQAWQFMNAVMAEQRVRSEVTNLRSSSEELVADLVKAVDVPEKRSWRPFQLAFVLLNLPSLVDPGHSERALPGSGDGDGLVDLLFFPTGGGKTEAYLGLTAYTFAIRRLQGVVGEGDDARDGRSGVAVLMRYTLRLLTAQQFQRAAALVCAAEQLRRTAQREQNAGGPPNLWGSEPFRIGLWVGAKVTPNSYQDACEAIANAKDSNSISGTGNPVQLLSCPWCALPISGKNAVPDDDRRRILLYCSDSDGLCAFGRKQSKQWGEGLPVVTVDEEVFRLAPSLVIGTVDKFAQLPLQGQTSLLFGRARSRCERHGYRHPDLADKVGCKTMHPSKGVLPSSKPQDCMMLRPPDLIIQDELHLIAGALGTMVGLYETVVDRLCTWTVNGTHRRAKVVASTATVRRAREQVHGLFARETAIFPPPLFDAGETFFSTQITVDDAHPGRRYLGICAHGVRLKQVQIRVAQLLLGAAMRQLDDHGLAADPYLTYVDYFSSTTELAGMRRMVEDDITKRVQRMARRGLPNRPVPLLLSELTGRVNSADIGATLQAAGYRFDPDLDSTAARQQAGEWTKAARTSSGKEAAAASTLLDARNAKRPYARRPIDVLLATSMLQVGVDVPRLGLMVVTGQPKNSAEYIQASSRVGRDPKRPGLVPVLYNWARPRDLAHFETFRHFHATAYAKVEALSVTPFAQRALDRGLAAVLVALIRHSRPDFEPETGAQKVPDHVTGPEVTAAVEEVARRAGHVVGDSSAVDRVRNQAEHLLDSWVKRRKGLETGGLTYTKTSDTGHALLVSSPTGWEEFSVAWSLREIEPEVNLLMKMEAPELIDGPAWSYLVPSGVEAGASEESDNDELPADRQSLRGGLDELGPVLVQTTPAEPPAGVSVG